MTKDPVCGMEVQPERAKAKYEYEGKIYYFCAVSCRTAFEKDPNKFLDE